MDPKIKVILIALTLVVAFGVTIFMPKYWDEPIRIYRSDDIYYCHSYIYDDDEID